LEGYLLKRSPFGVVKGWKRRWFALKGISLYYYVTRNAHRHIDEIAMVDVMSTR
jgi:hypothetical protein